MKKYKLILFVAAAIGLASCSDSFLTVQPTSSQATGGSATEGAILSNLASCYQILLMDSYANSNYNSIPLMSDLRSDDIYKGGSKIDDQKQLYLLSELNASATELPAGLWNIYYNGISRCNNVLVACDHAVNVAPDKLAQYQAEAHFLRAYYTHWLWKFWGNIPYFETDLPAPYMAKQLTPDEAYTKIIADVDFAIEGNKLPMRETKVNDGRVSRAAAIMLKSRVVMYQKDATRYPEVLTELNEIVSSQQYQLVNYAGIWLNSGEFCDESIFESNQLPTGRDWGAAWDGYGTNLPAFISPADLTGQDPFQGGWGFGTVRQTTWDLFEAGDVRKVVSINKFPVESYTARFQDTGLFMGKYAARKGYNPPPGTQDLNYDNNLRIFRYAETLLNIADLLVIEGVAQVSGGITAQACLDAIRNRAGLTTIPATVDNIKLERRREFVGEGLRFWDLVRWGDANILTENSSFSTRTWEDYKKYLPIPQSEIDKTEGDFKLKQNPGYN